MCIFLLLTFNVSYCLRYVPFQRRFSDYIVTKVYKNSRVHPVPSSLVMEDGTLDNWINCEGLFWTFTRIPTVFSIVCLARTQLDYRRPLKYLAIIEISYCVVLAETCELWIPVNLPEKGLGSNVTGLSAFGWHHLACKCIRNKNILSLMPLCY